MVGAGVGSATGMGMGDHVTYLTYKTIFFLSLKSLVSTFNIH